MKLPRRLKWDSEFFGIEIGAAAAADPEDIDRLLTSAVSSGIRLLYVSVPCGALETAAAAIGQTGAVLTDLRAVLHREVGLQPVDMSDLPAGYTVEMASAETAPAAAELARRCFRGRTRFYRDPGISGERCDDLYHRWVLRDSKDDSAVVQICKCEDGIAGFATMTPRNGNLWKIGLIGVSPEHRGRGLGTAMMSRLISHAYSDGARMETVTQLDRHDAVRFYESLGFRLQKVEFVVHLWVEGSG